MNLTSVSVLLATLALGGCAQGVIAANGDYMRAIAASFKVGMKATDVQTSLKELNAFSDIYNACSEQFESQLTPCDKGHNLVTTTRLPHHDPNLGQGDGQMYFTFDSAAVLTSFDYEIYYEAHH